ncbi:energy-coupling factor ABC transporter ATP-binding protein [Rhodospirillum rubrum]|uniref:ABC transporter component n=1 Tax=Rhodospirillum rubrum (strain ATCC 11170 / ATH 1.1.1 / DSM 467 / LMG 4362 / NCIMB 8255 / S1) TaxID=269796 RepID=Q2RN13_RHORT|nr:ABC transporter ATP-binding protein [Rhodospirillum rubrum]ABC24482.1 ABC transporter component [Rhodospirillum rubrum ATCC 11170]AEO50233.1 ABC transporter protein [Rhodospirillum rubrum F11]MBK1663516.1 ABC transporter ATP-binding protein [Rhodospirillum rubrum]MBK1677310.1 ABC transporter ATP-binding protein [Rhodospirillum rubrum]MBK5956208.1 ABC transporter ATP-binding protein [Rhodospirillum rubrum]
MTQTIVFTGVRVEAEDGRPILHDLTLTLKEARVGIIGANGAGKSTLIRLINGLAKPAAGTVEVDGMSVAKEVRAVRRKVGFLFQHPDAQIVMPTPAEDIAFGLKGLKLDKAEVARRVAAALARFGLAGFDDRPAYMLSGGEKQRLALAGVMALDPEILVMDEPTTMLDLAGRRMFARLVAGLAQRVVLATHDLDLLAAYDRVLVIDGGRIVHDGPPAQARAFYETLISARDGG